MLHTAVMFAAPASNQFVSNIVSSHLLTKDTHLPLYSNTLYVCPSVSTFIRGCIMMCSRQSSFSKFELLLIRGRYCRKRILIAAQAAAIDDDDSSNRWEFPTPLLTFQLSCC